MGGPPQTRLSAFLSWRIFVRPLLADRCRMDSRPCKEAKMCPYISVCCRWLTQWRNSKHSAHVCHLKCTRHHQRFRLSEECAAEKMYTLESVDHLAVRPERLLPEFLAALRAADPRSRALRILLVQCPEELGHLECDLLRLRLGSVEAFHLAEEVHMQVDLGSLRDAVKAVRLQPHVEPLPVVEGLKCDQVERLA